MWWSRPKILLVDGDPVALQARCRLLRRRFAVDTAATAEEAERMAGTRAYTAVLTDHAFSGRTGAWLLTNLAATQPGLRRILISDREVPDLAELRAAGIVDRYLRKPAPPEELLKALSMPCSRFAVRLPLAFAGRLRRRRRPLR
jgi:DNA-binding response OmpR family regulator